MLVEMVQMDIHILFFPLLGCGLDVQIKLFC